MSLGYMCPYAEMDISLNPLDWLKLLDQIKPSDLGFPEVVDTPFEFWKEYAPKGPMTMKRKPEPETGNVIPEVKARIIEEAKKRLEVEIEAPRDPIPAPLMPKTPNVQWQPNHSTVPVAIPRTVPYEVPKLSFSEVLAPTTIPIMLENVSPVPVPSAGMLPLSSLTPTVSYPMGMALLGDALRNAESASLSEKSVRESLTPLSGGTTSVHTNWTSDEFVVNQVGVQASMIDGVKKHITEKLMDVAEALDLKPYHILAAGAVASTAGGIITRNPGAIRAGAAAGSAAVASFASRDQTAEASSGLADYGSAGLPYI